MAGDPFTVYGVELWQLTVVPFMEVRKRLLATYSILIGLWSEGGGRELQRRECVHMGPRRGPEQGCRAVGLQGTGAGTGAKGWAWGAPTVRA